MFILDEPAELFNINEELKQLDEQLILLMARKQKLLKRKKKIEKALSSAPVADTQSWDNKGIHMT